MDIIHHPPSNWSIERKQQYLSWAEQVLEGHRGTNLKLENKLRELINEGRKVFTVAEASELAN